MIKVKHIAAAMAFFLLPFYSTAQNFGGNVKVFTNAALLQQEIYKRIYTQPTVLLLMSSGTFAGLKWEFPNH